MRFDTANEREDAGFEPLPKGAYRVMVGGSQMKTNKNGKGRHVAVELNVIDGQYRKRKLWHRFNVENANETAQRIGRGQMKSFLTAIGVTSALDLEQDLPAACRDKIIYVDIAHEEDRDGNLRESVKRFGADETFGGKGGKQAASSPVAPPRMNPDGTANVDDIPF